MRRTQGQGGSAYLVPAGMMSEEDRRKFEVRLDDFIEQVQQMVSLGDEIRHQGGAQAVTL